MLPGSAWQYAGSRTNSTESMVMNLSSIAMSLLALSIMNNLNVPHWVFTESIIFVPCSSKLIATVGPVRGAY